MLTGVLLKADYQIPSGMPNCRQSVKTCMEGQDTGEASQQVRRHNMHRTATDCCEAKAVGCRKSMDAKSGNATSFPVAACKQCHDTNAMVSAKARYVWTMLELAKRLLLSCCVSVL